jgi:hypothetical protein
VAPSQWRMAAAATTIAAMTAASNTAIVRLQARPGAEAPKVRWPPSRGGSRPP